MVKPQALCVKWSFSAGPIWVSFFLRKSWLQFLFSCHLSVYPLSLNIHKQILQTGLHTFR